MRIWSVHPQYLDTKGLVALWRETLLAKNVLEGRTKGYKNHPQLDRFKTTEKPIDAINYYLKHVFLEAKKRNFKFDKSKFSELKNLKKIDVTNAQISFEKTHLLEKLRIRDEEKYNVIKDIVCFEVHPLFDLIDGEIEAWEKVKVSV